jgi:GATA-binding protein
LDLSPHDVEARTRLLQYSTLFAGLKDDATDLESIESLQAQDPIGAQIWKLFSNTKAQIPNSDRFQNIAWRMMHMNLKKQRLVTSKPVSLITYSHVSNSISSFPEQTISSPTIHHPSGIAQLRKASDHHFATDSPSPQGGDPMNLDDFLVSTSIASPSPSDDNMMNTTAIPIPNKSFAAEQAALLSRTAPINHHAIRREGDFGYVNRHLRKTSIDDRRVSHAKLI